MTPTANPAVSACSSSAELLLSQVPAERILETFSVVAPLFQRTIDRMDSMVTLETLLGTLLLGDSQLWIAHEEDDEVIGACVTSLHHSGGSRFCSIDIAGGRDVRRWKDFIHDIEAWARREGCTRMQIPGRLGWQRLLKGYQPSYVVHRKELSCR